MSKGNLERKVVALNFWPACENCIHHNECRSRPKHPAYPHTWQWGADCATFPDGMLILRSWVGNSVIGQAHTGCHDYAVHPAHALAPDVRHLLYLDLEHEKDRCETTFTCLERKARQTAKDDALCPYPLGIAPALAERGFVCHGRDINAFRGKQWRETNHDLDFIVERDQVVYGVEVKNRLDYIDRHELQSKLDMCAFLGIRPLMIMRALPKTYIYEIMQYGGFAMVFEAQIYPFGSKELVKDIREVLGLKVDCPRAISEMAWACRNKTVN